MCGIIGMALKTSNGAAIPDMRMFEEMLYMDALRGEDCTGLAAFYNNGDMQVLKDTGSASWFRTTKDFEKVMQTMVGKGKAIIGHNRKKTVGAISENTAHPFILKDRFAFVHNGTLFNHEKLHKTEVDSEALGLHLTECEGDKEKLEEALGHVNGAYACAWIDQEKEKLYLIRNKERPLVLANTSIGYLFCSEYGFLLAAAARNRLKLEDTEVIDEDTLYTFDLGSSVYGMSFTKEKLTIKKSLPQTSFKVFGASMKKGGAAGNDPVEFPGTFSKNGFKRFKKKAIGRQLGFWLDDYVESDTSVPCRSWVLWGECHNIDPDHVVQGIVKDRSQSDIKNFYDGKYLVGRVTDVLLDTNDRIVVYLSEITPVPGTH